MDSGPKALDLLWENNFPLCVLFICIIKRLWSALWDGVPGPAETPTLGFVSVLSWGTHPELAWEIWMAMQELSVVLSRREKSCASVCIILTLALDQECKGVCRTMALTSDQGRTEQTQVMIRGRDISVPLISEKGRGRWRERAERRPPGGCARWRGCVRASHSSWCTGRHGRPQYSA